MSSGSSAAAVEKTGSAHAFKAMMRDAASASEKETQASNSTSSEPPTTATNTGADAPAEGGAPAGASAGTGDPAEENESSSGQTDVKGFEGFAAIPKKLAIAFETQNTDVLGLEPRPSSVSVQRKKRKAEVGSCSLPCGLHADDLCQLAVAECGSACNGRN